MDEFWKIYYGNDLIISSEDCDPFWVPVLNVQVIWCEVPGCSGLLYGRDYYWWDDNCWWAGEEAGRYQYEFKKGPKRVIYGTTIDTEFFNEIKKRASNDRSAWLEANK